MKRRRADIAAWLFLLVACAASIAATAFSLGMLFPGAR